MDVVLPKPGSYVLAVSGGVDSMVLLHILASANQANVQAKDISVVGNRAGGHSWKLVVAHLDHGMRGDSGEDRELVQVVAARLGLPFVFHEARLGAGTSEAVARRARYDFLGKTQRASGARAIVTAHHRDDVLETAIINLLRGSGRKGLTALGSRPGLERPLLEVPKSELVAYAREQGLAWREDSTNQDTRYLRNYVRLRLLPRFDEAARARLVRIISRLRVTNDELDTLLAKQLRQQARQSRQSSQLQQSPRPGQSQPGTLERAWFNQLPHAVAREVMAAWLRAHDIRAFDSRTLERLVVAAKVAPPGRKFDVSRGARLIAGSSHLALQGAER
jgi:tRNA(Ile)-lysidine synthetase-like protein